MSNSKTRKTVMGESQQDSSGLWHYHYMEAGGSIESATLDALQYSRNHPTWFWFNDTPCPIQPDDNVMALRGRWSFWRKQIQADPAWLLTQLRDLTPGRKSHPAAERYWLSICGLPWQEATQEQYIKAEESCGFYPKRGRGHVATASFGARGIQGRRTYGQIDASMGYEPEFVALANRS